MPKRALVVGAGFAGCVVSERLASAGWEVTLIDKRDHIGGNAYDDLDASGVLIHPYGPHIFHTNDRRIFQYLSQFTSWRFYEHRVRAVIDGVTYPIPINITTLNKLYGLSLRDEKEAETYLSSVRSRRTDILTSEDVLMSTAGPDLTEKFFRGYTRKQWGLDLSELSPSVAARVPVRFSEDDRYFTDVYSFMPYPGFASMFTRMVDKSNISVRLRTKYETAWHSSFDHLIYTGPVDEYFGHVHGKLPYRSLRFKHVHHDDIEVLQDVAVYNYPELSVPHTRVTEFKHLTGQKSRGTSLCYEYPEAEGDPYYPVPCRESQELYKKYESLAEAERGVTFVGRLAQYKYYNMDQVVGAALVAAKKITGE